MKQVKENYIVENGTYEDGILTVEANSVAKVKVSIFLTDEDKTYLDSTFANGMYVEGYITLDSIDSNIDLSIPWLAFYGDWMMLLFLMQHIMMIRMKYILPSH